MIDPTHPHQTHTHLIPLHRSDLLVLRLLLHDIVVILPAQNLLNQLIPAERRQPTPQLIRRLDDGLAEDGLEALAGAVAEAEDGEGALEGVPVDGVADRLRGLDAVAAAHLVLEVAGVGRRRRDRGERLAWDRGAALAAAVGRRGGRPWARARGRLVPVLARLRHVLDVLLGAVSGARGVELGLVLRLTLGTVVNLLSGGSWFWIIGPVVGVAVVLIAVDAPLIIRIRIPVVAIQSVVLIVRLVPTAAVGVDVRFIPAGLVGIACVRLSIIVESSEGVFLEFTIIPLIISIPAVLLVVAIIEVM